MEISALTRTVIKTNHALITPDGYVNSNVPGWEHCYVNVIINEAMGAHFCQTLITAKNGTKLEGRTLDAQIFFYVLHGNCKATVGDETQHLSKGHFVYIPVQNAYLFEEMTEGTQLLSFHKTYQKLEGFPVPAFQFGDTADIAASSFFGDEALQLKVLLPDHLSFDMAINVFTFDSGGHLPFVETHVMEHGLMFLQGQGVYMLDGQWYPVKKGDSIRMDAYCPQWFTAMGKEQAVYIYYKNINRFPAKI